MIYDESRAMAQSAKIAWAAMGLARSNNPGRTLKKVVNHTARSGVFVQGVLPSARISEGRASWHNDEAVVFFCLAIPMRRGATIDTSQPTSSTSGTHDSVMELIFVVLSTSQLCIQRSEDRLECAVGRGSMC